MYLFSSDFIILLSYIDDMLVVRSDLKKIKALKERMESEFAMKDLVRQGKFLK
jgi:uncharacterized membrane protein YkvA (DUF1232 family)